MEKLISDILAYLILALFIILAIVWIKMTVDNSTQKKLYDLHEKIRNKKNNSTQERKER